MLTQKNSIPLLVCAAVLSMFLYIDSFHQTAQFLIRRSYFSSNFTDFSVPFVDNSNASDVNPKRILFWTKFFQSVHFGVGFGAAAFQNCPVKNCIATNDRRQLPQSDAIVFHPWNMDMKDLPTKRSPGQRWIFFNVEPPPNIIGRMKDIQSVVFNWTMSYRMDSDIRRLYTDRMSVWNTTDSDEQIKEKLKSKKKLIAWFVSHCKTASRREDYVKNLNKFVKVDIYGACGPLKCADRYRRDECLPMVSRDYKFYLSFENTVCRDYVSEKLFNALANYVVPIVNGAVDYSQFAPSGSYIDTRDFESPRHLAEYLKYLDNNQTAYEQYFEWRKTYLPMKTCGWCQLCEMLNNSTLPAKSYPNIYNWFVTESHCGSKEPVEMDSDGPFNWTNETADS